MSRCGKSPNDDPWWILLFLIGPVPYLAALAVVVILAIKYGAA